MPLFQVPEVHHIYALQRQGKQKSYRCQDFSQLIDTLVAQLDNYEFRILIATEAHVWVDPLAIHEQGIEQAVESLEVDTLFQTWHQIFGLVGEQHLSSAIDKTRAELKSALRKTMASIEALVLSETIYLMYRHLTQYGPATGYSDRAIARAIATILLQCNMMTLEPGDDVFTVVDRLRKQMKHLGPITRFLARGGEKTRIPPDIDIRTYKRFRVDKSRSREHS